MRVIPSHDIMKYLAILLLSIPNLLMAGDLPNNSHLKPYGTGWDCNRGYHQSGQKCEKVIVPENAGLNYLGNGWTCNKGYKPLNNACVPMTSEELQKQNVLEQAILKKIQERKLRGVKGDDCQTEYKTNAEVCVRVTGGNLDCNKSFYGNYYRDCDATISYDVETNYSGGSYLDVEVECTVEIEYTGRQTYFKKTDSSSNDESHTLYAYGSDSESMTFNFSFSSYEEATKVRISSAKCEIQNVDLW